MRGMAQEKRIPARMPVPIAEAPIMPATEANSASTDLKKSLVIIFEVKKLANISVVIVQKY